MLLHILCQILVNSDIVKKKKDTFFWGPGLVKYHHFWKLPLMSCGNQKTMPKKQCHALKKPKKKKKESERVFFHSIKRIKTSFVPAKIPSSQSSGSLEISDVK